MMMHIRFVDLIRQNKLLRLELNQAIEEVVKNGDFILGKDLSKFEKRFAKYCGKRYAIGLNSGTDALGLALLAYGIGPGDEVITAPNSYFSTAMVISQVGATPVFADVNPDTSLINLKAIQNALSEKTKAIIPVHLYGRVVEMDPLLTFAKDNNLIVIEDACQAVGANYKRRRVPIGETGAFSFYPGKNLGCFGDGGAIVTDNKKFFDKILYLRNDGSRIKYKHDVLGFKSRLDNLQAAVLNLKLQYMDRWNTMRRKNAKRYNQLLRGVDDITLPLNDHYESNVHHLFVIEYARRDDLKKYLKKKGIETGIHYPIPIHLQRAYKFMNYKIGDFPVSEEKASTILSLPMFPELKETEIDYVVENIKRYIEKN